MRFGYFDNPAKEYVIERPDTPRSWSNYLGSTEYGSIITNNAGGYSFYQSAAQGRLTRLLLNNVPMDQPGRYLYVRDQESGDYWSASWQPVGKPRDQFRSTCRHGTAYSVITSEYSGIATESTYFVPLDANFECWIFKLSNTGSTKRKLRLFTYVEYTNEWHVYHDTSNLQFSQYIVKCEVEGNSIEQGILTNVAEDPDNFQNRDQARYTFLTVADLKPGATLNGFDTSREQFIGVYGDYSKPQVVAAGECLGSLAHGDNACGVRQIDVELGPGQGTDFLVLMGVGRLGTAGAAAIRQVPDVAAAGAELERLKQHWHARLRNFTVQSPDAEFDSMVNVWNAYNCLITFAWSRAASLVYAGGRDGLGYRDTVQDIMGVLPNIAAEAGQRLELMITGQCSNGGAMPVVKPFAHRPGTESLPHHYRADDCLWLFMTIPAYVKETGNIDFYKKVLPYADQGSDTVFGHLRRALEFNLAHTGQRGLPSGLEADWNDALRLGEGGSSVFVAFQMRLAFVVFVEIAELLGEQAHRTWAQTELEKLDAKLAEHCWDGDWYVRAFREDGTTIGTHLDPEGSIFLNPQSFAVLSGHGDADRARRAMDSVKERLATPYGIALCNPPFEKTDYQVMRAVIFNKGMKENGGIFCHPQGWAVIAEALLGRGDRAYEYYRSYMPAAYNEHAEIREIEPYVHCQSTHAKDSRLYGRSRLPWLSGTAAWSYVAATNYILGIQPEYSGLKIDPQLPKNWPSVKVQRVFRGKRFEIDISRGKEWSMSVNGRRLDSNVIPSTLFSEVNRVQLVLPDSDTA